MKNSHSYTKNDKKVNIEKVGIQLKWNCEKRSKIIHIRLSENEYLRLQEITKIKGCLFSDYIRELILSDWNKNDTKCGNV